MSVVEEAGRSALTTHEMVLVGHTESGAEEWQCPTCGRRTALRWPPRYERTVLARGDDTVAHVGGTGGLRMGEPEVTSRPAVAERDQQWLADNGIAWDGGPA
jgi:hypothetical protein